LVISFAVLTGFASKPLAQDGASFWFIFWLILTYTSGIYAASTLGDLRRAYLLVTGKPWYSWTPFDLLYQPLVDWNDIRRKIASGEIDAEQD
jgi:hypothetical protein